MTRARTVSLILSIAVVGLPVCAAVDRKKVGGANPEVTPPIRSAYWLIRAERTPSPGRSTFTFHIALRH